MTAITPRDYRNMLLLFATQVIAVGVSILTFILITRLFEIGERGRFGFATSTTIFVTLLAELGIRYIAIREIVRDALRSRSIYRHTLLARLLFSGLSLVVLLLLLQLIAPWRSESYLLWVAGLGAVTQFSSEPAAWVFLAQNRMGVYSTIHIIDRLLYMVTICGAAIIFRTAEALLWAILAANLLRMLLSSLWLRHAVPARPEEPFWEIDILKRLVIDGSTVGMAAIISVTYSQFSVILLQGLVSPQELGIYSVAFGLVSLLSVVPIALTSAIFPSLSRANSHQEIHQLYRSIAQINLSAIFPLAVGLMIFAPIATQMIGARYEKSVLEIRILSVGMIALALNYVYRMFLLTQKRPWAEIFADGLAMGLIVVLSVIFCPLYGGLAMTVIFSSVELGLLLIKIILTWRWMGRPPYIGILLRAAAATSLAAAITSRFELLLLQLIVYGLMCSVLLFAFRVVPPVDWKSQIKRFRMLLVARFESQ